MIVIVDNQTGKVLYCSNVEVEINSNETLIEVENLDFVNPYYNFQTGLFFESLVFEDVIVPVPDEVPLWKIKAYLINAGLIEQIESAINGLEDPEIKTAALCIWQFGTAIERNSPTVQLIQMALQMTNSQVDAIFIEANNIQL